jgi:hypothetical protein
LEFNTARALRRKRAVAGIIAAVILFTMMFTVGLGYFLFVNASNGAYDTELATRVSMMQDELQENLQVAAAQGSGGTLTVTITNAGGIAANAVALFVTTPSGTVSSFGTGLPSNTNPALPLPVSVGRTTSSIDTGISVQPGTYVVKVLTQRGSSFTTTYPPQTPLSVGGNALLVQMVATPPQVLSGAKVTDSVTVSNYGSYAVTGVTLQPSPPTASVTGTATLTGGSCSPTSFASIPAYSGSGNPSSVTFTCTYTAETGPVGGFASFSGYAQATMNGVQINSPEAVSNTIQIGGSANVPTQGPFSISAFFFGYSSCTNAPSGSRYGGYYYNSPCTTSPSAMPPSSPSRLPNGATISGGSNYYIAYYVQVTNNFNATLPILEYSFMFMDPDNGADSALFLVGTATSPQTPYYPNYASSSGQNYLPQLTAYTATQTTCAESPPNYNPPPPTQCIDVAPSSSVTLTFAACGFGSSSWAWGGSQYDQRYDSGASGCSSSPGMFTAPDGTYISVVISYIYKGVTYTQASPYQGQIILP